MEVTAGGEQYCEVTVVYKQTTHIQAEKEERLQHAKQAKQELEQLKVKREAAQQKKVAAERERSKQKLIEWKKELKHHKEEMAQQVLLQKAADMAKQKEKENERRVRYPATRLSYNNHYINNRWLLSSSFLSMHRKRHKKWRENKNYKKREEKKKYTVEN